MTKQRDDYNQQRQEPIEVFTPPNGFDCPQCGHFPLVYEEYDGGYPLTQEPYGYYECLECRYRTDED